MKKTVEQYLMDLDEYINRIINSLQDITEAEYSKNVDLQDSILRRLEVIGEIVRRMPDKYKHKNSEVPWRDIAGIRNVLAHDYDGVNMKQVWRIATNDIPKLKGQVTKMIEDVSDHIYETD